MPTDFRSHLNLLKEHNRLVVVNREINKDTELHPLVRLQFLAHEDIERKGFLFERVTDAQHRKYNGRVAVGCLSSSSDIYSLGVGCDEGEIWKKWIDAVESPVDPKLVITGPVKDEIHQGKKLLEHGGLSEFPIPISTPGFDNAPYLTACCWISKDCETGQLNSGVYRGQLKSSSKTSLYMGENSDMATHWDKCNSRGKKLEVAGFIGGNPCLTYASVQKIPYDKYELAVAGRLIGEPVKVVKCETVDLSVPADAEIVIEGFVRTDYMEPDGPFGEAHGYIDPRVMTAIFEVTCITHRKNPVLVSILSQVTPNESSKIKLLGFEPRLLQFLQKECRLPSVRKVSLHERLTNVWPYIIIQLRKTSDAEPWQAMNAALGFRIDMGKVIIAVDEDVDPANPSMVNWALCHRMQPHKDIQIIKRREIGFSPIRIMSDMGETGYDPMDSSILIDATRKAPFPPVALPAKEHMKRAMQIWNSIGLPKITTQDPWYGYTLGYWPEECEDEARLALSGKYYSTGEKLARRGIKVRKGKSIKQLTRHLK